MTAPDPRLDEIQARLDAVTEWRRHFHAPHNLVDYSQRDVPFLLAELRKAHEALARVETLADQSEPFKGIHGYTSSGIVLANDIYAAVAAAKGDGQEKPRNSVPAPPVPGWGELKKGNDGK